MGELRNSNTNLNTKSGSTTKDEDVKKMKLIKVMENGWKEYQTHAGRKLYYHEDTNKITWKPPRKVQFSSPPILEYESSVGTVLKEGTLNIARLTRSGWPKSKKWMKCLVVLTNSHLIFRKVKKLDYKSGCLPLISAHIKEEHFATKKDNTYQLNTKKESILLRKSDSIDSESWYHAILIVIENLSSGIKIGRVESFTQRRDSACFSFHRPFLEDTTKVELSSRDEESVTDNISHEINNLKFKFPTPPGWAAKYEKSKAMFVYEWENTGELWGAAERNDGSIYFYNIETAEESFLLPTRRKLETSV